ncbi:MAG: MotA/TolQ/ExbB proton channel family protein [Spirochaetales bacterium]|nr:MotA/TolQ/ExbB proton channel family protein [Spirochaetales bacterium]
MYIIFSIVSFIILIIFATLDIGFSLMDIWSLPSLLIAILPAFFSTMAGSGWKPVDHSLRCLLVGASFSAEEGVRYAEIYRQMGNIALWSGFIGSLGGAIKILSHIHLGDPQSIGAGSAACLITTLYAVFFKTILCIPAELHFKVRRE